MILSSANSSIGNTGRQELICRAAIDGRFAQRADPPREAIPLKSRQTIRRKRSIEFSTMTRQTLHSHFVTARSGY